MRFANIREALLWGGRKYKTKKDLVREVENLWETVDKLYTKVNQLDTITIHHHDNQNFCDKYNLHDVVVALLNHTGTSPRARVPVELELKDEG